MQNILSLFLRNVIKNTGGILDILDQNLKSALCLSIYQKKSQGCIHYMCYTRVYSHLHVDC